jgi:glutathione S-transferase
LLRCYRTPFSTNVERVALALAHKGLDVEWIDVDPADRSEVERISGQPLVPVLVDDDRVVHDSTAILHRLEEMQPEPRLFPAQAARRAEAELFLDWFNRIWKRPPNEIEAERVKNTPDEERIASLGLELTSSLDLFEALLSDREYLLGDFGVADCAAFPFLKYAALHDPDDDEAFHLILAEYLQVDGGHPSLKGWIRRVDERPRA